MRSNHFAVVVGIDRYPEMPDRSLQYARNDAVAFYEWLTSPNGGRVPSDNAKLITVTEAEQASGARRPVRSEVTGFLKEFHKRVDKFDEPQWSESRLYIYLSGHGVTPSDGLGALIFANSDPPFEWGEVLDLDICQRFYVKTPFFREIVLLGDFCREIDAGIPAIGELTFGKSYRGSRPTRRVTGYGTSMSQKSGEPKEALQTLPAITTIPPTSPSKREARGFFTRAVLEGLRGGAIPDPISGVVDIDRLNTYVKTRMPQLARSSYQEPDISYNAKDLVLVKYEVVPRYPVDLLVPKDFAQPIDLVLWGKSKVMDTWMPGDPLRWRVLLPAANYEVVARSGEYRFQRDGSVEVRSSPDEGASHEMQGDTRVYPL
jgi:hypothetical protein